MWHAAEEPAPGSLRVPAILLVEHDLTEAGFVQSVIADVLKANVWLWHEATLDAALKLLAIVQFRLILLDLDLPHISARKAVKGVRAAAPRTPLMLRLRPEEFRPEIDPRVYHADALAPKGVGEPVLRMVRRVLAEARPGGSATGA